MSRCKADVPRRTRGTPALAKIVAIANQKGGVGKTTTTINLGACLAQAGRTTLLVDIDPQAHTTSGLGLEPTAGSTVYEMLLDGRPATEVLLPTHVANLCVLPASIDLAGAEVELVGMVAREHRLKQALTPLRERFQYILIDCPPSLGLLTLNALTAADSVLVPIQCEYYALEGLGQLMNTLGLVRTHLNPTLEVEGVLLTMFDGRTNLSIQVADEVKRHFYQQVFRTIIPRNVRLSEAPSHGQPITLYDGRSRGADVYKELAQEVIVRVEGQEAAG